MTTNDYSPPADVAIRWLLQQSDAGDAMRDHVDWYRVRIGVEGATGRLGLAMYADPQLRVTEFLGVTGWEHAAAAAWNGLDHQNRMVLVARWLVCQDQLRWPDVVDGVADEDLGPVAAYQVAENEFGRRYDLVLGTRTESDEPTVAEMVLGKTLAAEVQLGLW